MTARDLPVLPPGLQIAALKSPFCPAQTLTGRLAIAADD